MLLTRRLLTVLIVLLLCGCVDQPRPLSSTDISNNRAPDKLVFREAWRLQTDGFVDASPLVVEDKLFTASWDGSVYAIDTRGRLLWKKAVGAEIDATPVSDGAQLFVQTWERRAFALSLVDGQVRWSFQYPESPADDHRQGALLPLGEQVLLPAWGGTLYALDATSGQLRWQYGEHLPLRSAPVREGTQLYLSGGDGSFLALSLAGARLWSAEFDAPLLTSAALTPDGPVAVARDGLIKAFTGAGRLRWQRQLKELCYYSMPRYYQGAIYLATAAGSLWKLNAETGEPVWQQTGLGAIYASPLITGQRLYLGTNDGWLYAIDLHSGQQVASFQTGSAIQSTPVIFGGRLVFGSRDGNLYALDLLE
jgi:outer membrane protein assembly factor BamB